MTIPTGVTIAGAIGVDLQAPTGAPLSDFGTIGSLPQAATCPIHDGDVIVVIKNDAPTGWGCNNTDPACVGPGNCCDTTPVESSSNTTKRTTGGCNAPVVDDGTTDCCPGDTQNPAAAPGKVCIFVSGGTNAANVHGTSVLNGPSGASTHGFKLNWENAGDGETYLDAVWAYQAPDPATTCP